MTAISDRGVEETPSVRQSNRAERLLVPATFITMAGNSFQLTAAAVLLFRSSHTTLAVGWLFILVGIPQVLLSIFFGRLADRFDRRTLCVVADLTSAVSAAALPLWIMLGGKVTVAAYLTNFALAATAALFMPASNALIKERIRHERIGPFSAHFEMATNGGMLLASGAAGFLIESFGVKPLFFANAVSFVISAAAGLALGRRPSQAEAPAAPPTETADTAENAGTEHAAGAAATGEAARRRSPVFGLAVMFGSGQISPVVTNTILVTLVLHSFRKGPGLLGLVDALAGLGFLVSAGLFQKISARLGGGLRLLLIGYLSSNLMVLLEPLHWQVLVVAMPISGFCYGLGRVQTRALLTKATPAEQAGRVFGVTNAFALGVSSLATIGLAVLADHSSAAVSFWVLAGLMTASVLATAASLRGTDLPS